jgi:NAD(P)-dependent dehydrogenase (short-subunit alcohol dehydrogenase family)
MRFDGKVALVSGEGSGIGRATATGLRPGMPRWRWPISIR